VFQEVQYSKGICWDVKVEYEDAEVQECRKEMWRKIQER
jgi:hypothetical protein